MLERRFEARDVIYHEGDPGDAVFVIQDGSVEVLRDIAGSELRLAILDKGEIFGEMGVINEQPRSTTVRAVAKTSLVAIPKDDFLKIFSKEKPMALRILRLLCGRILRADNQLVSQKLYSDAPRQADVAHMQLLPASSLVESQIGPEGVSVDRLPYNVGRDLDNSRASGADVDGLKIEHADVVHMSSLHFVIEADRGRLRLRDLHSNLGTLVNGRRIARFEQFDTAYLHLGKNEIQAGGTESPYRFRLILEHA
jgi:CRP/FNR family transcriptional regulator, cyclic AMP receptor protein